jgi:dsDNA-binding SOS-regulon protein
MNLSDMRLPRELEADGTAGPIRQILMVRTVQLWSGSDLYVPMITMGDSLKKVLQRANISGHVRCGLEAIASALEKERRGIGHLREGRGLPTGDRVSRLLLISSDGAQRFYRHIEHLLQLHAPRLLGGMLDMDGNALGSVITGKERQIKVIMAEHKDAVSELLRALLEGRGDQ